MRKERIILLIYHGQGHFNACFGAAKILSKNYDVWFAGYPYFKRYIISQGFQFYPLTTLPFGLGFERWVAQQEKRKQNWWQELTDRWSDRLYHARKHSLEKMIDELVPEYMLIDSWQSTDFIVMYPTLKEKKIRAGFIQTMLSTVITSHPPLTSPLMPDNRIAIEREIKKFLYSKWRKRFLQWLCFFGTDNLSIIGKWIKKNHIPEKYKSKYGSLFSVAFESIPEFILAPIELEFDGFVPLRHQHYVGSMLNLERNEHESKEFSDLFLQLGKEKRQIIYCSFGSTDLEEAEEIKPFLQKLMKVADDQNWLCILSSGSKRILDFVNEHSNNAQAFQSVPQLKILQHADAFITHGGLNSIKEALHFKVPMLVYPVKENTDHHGNAARITYHKLGLRGSIKQDTEKDIQTRIADLLENALYKNNINTFNQKLKGYSPDHFLKLFQLTQVIK